MVKRKHTLILGYALTQTGQGVRGEVIAASQIRQQHKMVCILNPIVSVLQQMSSLCSVSCGKKVEMKTVHQPTVTLQGKVLKENMTEWPEWQSMI